MTATPVLDDGLDDPENQPPPSRWLKIKDGDDALLIMAGRSSKFQPKPFNEGDKPPPPKWRQAFYNLDLGTIQTWDYPYPVFDQLQKIKKRAGDLFGKKLCISRSGTGKQTAYTVGLIGDASESELAARNALIASVEEGEIPF